MCLATSLGRKAHKLVSAVRLLTSYRIMRATQLAVLSVKSLNTPPHLGPLSAQYGTIGQSYGCVDTAPVKSLVC